MRLLLRRAVAKMDRHLHASTEDSRASRRGAHRALSGSLVAGGLSQAALVVSGVLVARVLGPEDRGYMALVFLVPSLLALVGSLGIPLASTYFVARSPESDRAIATKLLVPACLQAALAVLLTLGAFLTVLSGQPARVISAGLVATAFVPALLAQTYGLALLQGQRRFRAFNVLRVTPPALYSLGVLGAFLTGFHSLVQLTVVAIVTNVAAAGLIIAVLLRGLAPRGGVAPGEVPSLSQLTRFGLKGFIGSVSPVENFRIDQAAVALFLNPVSLGFYVVAQAIINLPRFLAQSVGMIAYPSVAARRDPRAARRSLWRHVALAAALTLGTVAILEVAVPRLVSLFFGAAFSEAVPIARILLIGALFAGVRRVLADGLRGSGYPSLGTIAEAASWVVMLPAMIVLAPMFGPEGVALAVTLAWAASLVVLLAATALVVHRQGKRLGGAVGSLAARNPGLGPRSAGFFIAAVVSSLLAAGATVFLPPYTSLGLAALLGVLLLAALVRRELSHRLPWGLAAGDAADVSAQGTTASASGDGDHGFRLARLFYYAGFLVLGQLTFRATAVGTVSDLFFLLSFASTVSLLAMYRRRVEVPLPPLIFYGLLVFALGSFASTFASLSPNASIAVVARLLIVIGVWFWLGTMVLRRMKHILTAAALWVASASLNGIAAIAQLSIDPDIIPGGRVHWGRVSGFTEHMNDLGAIAALALIPALMFCMRPSRNPVYALTACAGLLLAATGLILSGAVAAILAAAIAALLCITAAPRLPARLFVLMGVALVAAYALVQIQESKDAPTPAERLESVAGSPTDPNATLWSRIDTNRVAIDRILDNPFTGVGLDDDSSAIGKYVPHNLVIGVWFRAGFLGLAGLILVIVAIFSTARATLRDAASVDERMLAVALLSSFVAFIVFSMSAPILFTRYGWAPAALLLALRAVQLRRAAPEVLSVQTPPPDVVRAHVHLVAQPR